MYFKNPINNRFFGSVSGWEKSHFGGYSQILWDYPYIKLDFQVQLCPDPNLCISQGVSSAEKLLKIYLIKAKSLGLINEFESVIEERKTFFGATKKVEILFLNNEDIFSEINEKYKELSPLFVHYKNDIFKSTIELDVNEDEDENDQDQDGQDQDQDQDGQDQEGKEEKKGKPKDKKEDKKEDKESKEDKSESPEKKKKKSEKISTSNSGCEEGKLKELLEKISEHKPIERSSLGSFGGKPVFEIFDKKEYKGREYKFTAEEKKNSEHIIKLLDISFDPKSDVIKSLRTGKLDGCKIAEVPAGNLSIYKQEVEDQDTKPFSICILADMSGSMDEGTRISDQKTIMNSLYLAMSQIVEPTKLHIYGHTGHESPVIYTFCSPYDQEYTKNILHYDDADFCENYDGPVIEAIHKRIRETTDDRIIFISLSDGLPCGSGYGGQEDNDDLKRILEKARRDDFVTVGIGIESNHVKDLYTYSKSIDDLSQMAKEVSSLVNMVVRAEFK